MNSIIKKGFLCYLLLLIALVGFGQKQRMVVLPTSMNYSPASINTMCIDFFREVPTLADAYENIVYSQKDALLTIGEKTKPIKKIRKYEIVGESSTLQMNFQDVNTDLVLKNENPFIISQVKEGIDNDYLDFVLDGIESNNKQGFGEDKHWELQLDIWRYNILDNYGYIKPEVGVPTQKFNAAKAKFFQDFKTDFVLESSFWGVELGDNINKTILKELNENVNFDFKVLAIKRTNDGRYIVFDGEKAPIYSGSSEVELASTIASRFDKEENLYLDLRSFQSIDKEETFAFSLQNFANNKFKKNLGINIWKNQVGADLLVYESDHTLRRALQAEQIKESPEGIFNLEIQLNSSGPTRFDYYNSLDLDLLAESKNKSVLNKLVDYIRNKFDSGATNFSMSSFLGSYKKMIKRNSEIKSDEEFKIYLQSEFSDFQIVIDLGDSKSTNLSAVK
ncbi:MAG: hypothetical protein ABJP45_03965 [Cyclobacteriaceae bacterium]